MLRILCVLALAAVAARSQEATLKVGSDAPPLTIAKWVKAGPVTLEKGKIYVVEFWATWCVPCVMSMPHLSELQDTYKDKVTFIGVTGEDQRGNTLEAVEAMAQERGPGMGYAVAWDDADKTHDAWLRAAGIQGIPCAFVVDASGKIAHISLGYPPSLDIPLARIVAGTWDPAKGPEEIKTALKRRDEILQMDRRMALDAIAVFEKDYPELAWAPVRPSNGAAAMTMPTAKLRLLLLTGRNEEASALGARITEKAVKYNSAMGLNEVAWLIVDPEMEVKRDLELAMDAAQKAVELSKGEDGAILDTLARVYYWKGDLAKAIEIQTKAVEKDPSEPSLQSTLDEYKEKAAAKKE